MARLSHSVREPQPTPTRASHHGVAMLLVLFAVAMAVVLSMSFLSSQGTTTAIAQNVRFVSQARQIAESALSATLHELKSNADWRTTRINGVWYTDHPLLGSTFTLKCEDGVYNPATGLVDGDGDLANNATDRFTITVIGTSQGRTHVLRAVVTPPAVMNSPHVLMIVADPDSLTPAEETRKATIESWNWQVTLLAGHASAQEYTDAIATAHVVYVPEDGGSGTVGARLVDAEIGVVFEDGDLFAEMKLSTEQSSFNGAAIRIVDNSHYITQPFPIGELVIASTSAQVEVAHGTITGGLRPLAWWPGTERRVLATIDLGQPLSNGMPSPGRRAALPFSGFTADDLNDDGRNILRRALEWSAQSASGADEVITLNSWTKSTTVPLVDSDDRLLVVTVGAETHTSLTSLTYGNQPMTLVASAYESTGVGARSYIYILNEAALKAATDRVIRSTWTSGTRDDTSFASRLYGHVNQANPMRTSEWATNAGPPTISCAAMSVTRGDVVISSVRVGHENRNFVWTSPMVIGTQDQLSTSTHTAADYTVANGVTSVAASATCNAPNRQAMVAAAIQPRSRSNGGGIIPTTLVLYEFNEVAPEIKLVGHWPLDDDGTGGALAITGNVALSGSAKIEGYGSASGAYGGSNSGKEVTLVTNTSSSGGISVSTSAVIQGSTYNRPGANPTTVVSISGNGSITSNRYEQSVQFTLPTISAPTGMPATQGNQTIAANTTLSSDAVYATLTVNTGVTITIQGDVRIQLTDDLIMNGNAKIVIPANSRLRLYVNDDITMSSDAEINNVTNAPARFELHQYGANPDLTIGGTSTITGILKIGRNLSMNGSASIHGATYIGGTLTMNDTSRLRIDKSLPGFGITPVAEGTATNPAQSHDNVIFQQAGARAFTGTSLRFDGVKNFVRIPHHDSYLISHGTISFWFNSESLAGNRAIFSKDSAGFDTGGHLHIYTEGNTLKARIQSNGLNPYGSGDDFTVSAGGLSTNTWYHVVVSFGAGGLRLYTDGSLRQAVVYPGGLGANSGGLGNFQPIVLGAGTSTAGDLTHLPVNEYFVGRIDDVRIYNGILDANQIDRLFQGQPLGSRTEASYIVADTSGLGEPLNLFIDNTQAVAWPVGGGLTINQATVIRSANRPDKLRNGVTATGQMTIEVIATAAALPSAGRLFWYGSSSGVNTNIDVYQDSSKHHARIRSVSTPDSPAILSSEAGAAAGSRHHVLVTYRDGLMRIYRDGGLVAESAQTGSLLSWDSAYGLALANLPGGTSGWLGTIEHVAVYDRAMNNRQVGNLFEELPPGDGASVSGGYQVHWIEDP